jgi:hypothetical protein
MLCFTMQFAWLRRWSLANSFDTSGGIWLSTLISLLQVGFRKSIEFCFYDSLIPQFARKFSDSNVLMQFTMPHCLVPDIDYFQCLRCVYWGETITVHHTIEATAGGVNHATRWYAMTPHHSPTSYAYLAHATVFSKLTFFWTSPFLLSPT